MTGKNTGLLVAIVALSTIEFDLVKYGPGHPAGDELEVTEAQAEHLVLGGSAAYKKAAVAAQAGDGEGAGGAGGDAGAGPTTPTTVVAITSAATKAAAATKKK